MSAKSALRALVIPLALVTAAAVAQDGLMLITDFDSATDLGWYVVNDDVMGGRSDGGFGIDEGVLVFAGATNTRGGGFASIRTSAELAGLPERGVIVLSARGDGRRYVLRLEDDAGTAYWAEFDPPPKRWARMEVPLNRFRPRFRGRWLDGPDLDPSRVVVLGFMCYDGLDGPFRLEVKRIEAQ